MKILKESFSNSMPLWLVKNLEKSETKLYRTDRNKDTKYKSKRDLSDVYDSSYTKNDRQSLYTKLLNKGLDLSSAKFIKGDIPTSSRDKRLKDPFIGFLLLEVPSWKGEKEQVYAPGINENEEAGFTYTGQGSNLFKYIPFKEILPYVRDFVYVDTSDPNNMVQEKPKVPADPDFTRYPTYDKLVKAGWQTPYKQLANKIYYNELTQDKSGYIRDPYKYKKLLANKQAGRYGEFLQSIYDRLTAIKQDLSVPLMDIDLTDKRAYVKLDEYQSLLRDYSNVLSDYNDLLSHIDNWQQHIAMDPSAEKDFINWLANDVYNPASRYSYKNKVESRLKNMEDKLKDYRTVVVDWDNPE